jgi:hypothetical protein
MPGKESAVILASSASTCHAYASLDIAPARLDFDVMTETDIDKAMSEFELVGNRRNAWDMMFRDPKTRKFWEVVYPAEGGPRQLRPITSHEARIQYSGRFPAGKPRFTTIGWTVKFSLPLHSGSTIGGLNSAPRPLRPLRASKFIQTAAPCGMKTTSFAIGFANKSGRSSSVSN